MNRETFLSILKEENVEFRVDENQDVVIREEYVLIEQNCGDDTAYITPDKDFIEGGIFQTTLDPTPISKVTREDLMKMVEAYRNTDM